MADPSSFAVGNAPQGASYAAPLLDFSRLANAPQTIFEAQQRARVTALQHAFPKGLSEFKDPKTGQYDIGGISDRLTKIGGAEFAQQTLPLLLQQQISTGIGQGLSDIDQSLPGGRGSQSPGQTSPATPAASAAPTAQARSAPVVQPTSSPAAGPANITGDFQQRQQQMQGTGRPNAPSGVSGSSPAPVGGNAPQQSAPQQDAIGAAGQPFSQYPAMIQRYDQAIARVHALGVQAGVAKNPELQKSLEARAAGLQTDRDKLLEEYQNNLKPTEATKTATEAGYANPIQYEAAKKVQDEDLKHFGALNTSLQALGDTSAAMLNKINLQNALVNNPEFYSGTAETAALFLRRAIPSFAGEAAPMELYKKVLSGNMLDLVTQMKEEASAIGGTSGSGRIFAPMIKMVEDANGTLDNSVLGLRSLAILNKKTAERNIQIADFATAYKSGDLQSLPPEFRGKSAASKIPGVLDDRFEKGLRDWTAKHPLLTQEEQDDPRVLGARTFHTPQEAKAAGVKSDEPVRTDDGRIMYVDE